MLIRIYRFEVDGWVNVDLMPMPVHRRISQHRFYEDGKPRLEKFYKDWTNLVAYGVGINKQFGVNW